MEEKFTLLFAQPGCQVVLQVQAWGMGCNKLRLRTALKLFMMTRPSLSITTLEIRIPLPPSS